MQSLKKTLLGMAATTCLLTLTAPQVQAGQLHNSWNYGIDAFNDGSGGANFEIKGMAIKETGDKILVAITGGMPLTGAADSGAADGNIGWADLFFNFTGGNFQAASNSSSLFGVRFAGTNDSYAPTTGVYRNVQATSVTSSNNGYNSLKQYYDAGWEKTNSLGTDFATAQAVYEYYYPSTVASNPNSSNTPILNVISSGTKVGNINMLTLTDLTAAGLNFGYFGAAGTQTIGFSFDKALLAQGNYIASLWEECGNDGVALKGVTTPEPASIFGLAIAGTGLLVGSRRRHKTA
ncbi:MAG: PEP-CTERM sorting domain-containing protein [Nostocales cyanobacterium]|nr:MAG: PEP-CTERM sorting domain-containing protein [Nostocales cyanobacterium]